MSTLIEAAAHTLHAQISLSGATFPTRFCSYERRVQKVHYGVIIVTYNTHKAGETYTLLCGKIMLVAGSNVLIQVNTHVSTKYNPLNN
jgi:hypothetical protein